MSDSARVLALARVSNEEQAVEGRTGLQQQWRDIEAVCRRDNLTIAHRFTLEGVSGSNVRLNPQFRKMLKAVSAPGIAGLVISSPDRLMRCDKIGDLAILEPFGDETRPRLIWTINTTYNLTKFENRLLFMAQTLIGGNEKKQIIIRTQGGKTLARERDDQCPDKPPQGVEFIVTNQKARTGYYRFTAESKPVKIAFERVLDRNTSIQALAKELGFKSYQSMRKQLTNPIWTGYRVSTHRREKLTPGLGGKSRSRKVPRLNPVPVKINLNGAEPLIPQGMFDEVQQILAGIYESHMSRRSGKSKFQLSGLIRCPCGERYYSKHDDRSGKSGYYVCKSGYFDASEGCSYSHLNRAEADARILAQTTEILTSKERLTQLIADTLTPSDSAQLKEERDQLRARVESLTGKRTRLIDRISDGLIYEDEARISVAKIRSDIESAAARLSDIERKLSLSKVADVGKIVTAVARLFKKAQFRSTESRRALVTKVVDEIQLGDNKEIRAIRLKIEEINALTLAA